MENKLTAKFIKKQHKVCKAIGTFMFMPGDGRCFSCGRYIIDELIKRGNNGSELVTGCPFCKRSYCD